jgi:hypothetical protein
VHTNLPISPLFVGLVFAVAVSAAVTVKAGVVLADLEEMSNTTTSLGLQIFK